MLQTLVGYAGGTTPNPTYHDLERHTEVVSVVFDASILPLEQLLDLFWQGHDPRRESGGSQYRAVFLSESEEQHQAVIASRDSLAKKLNGPIATEVILGLPFYPAEDYHQKWKLRRNTELYTNLAKNFSSEQDVFESFSATKLNAMIGGNLAQKDRAAALRILGDSPAAKALNMQFQSSP